MCQKRLVLTWPNVGESTGLGLICLESRQSDETGSDWFEAFAVSK